MIEFKYRPDVDGLRAIAVILVLLYHAGLGFTGGFVGVDVFFVISGYLITGLILKQQQSRSFRLSNFWTRRIRRILPAATVVVAVTWIAGYWLLLPTYFSAFAESAIAQQFMVSNIYFWRTTGYFDGSAELKPLLHTWSLGVEEQFYLWYPFLLVLLNRYCKRFLAVVLSACAILSFGISEWGLQNHAEATFYLLPTRAWELLLGGLLCFVSPLKGAWHWPNQLLSLIGIVAIGIAGWYFDTHTRFPGVAALLPCLGAAFLIYANTQRLTWIGNALAAKPIVFVGLLSYSLYLWHWPILAFLRQFLGTQLNASTGLLALAASLVLATLSWRFIETPFRQKKIFPSSKGLLLVFGGTFALLFFSSLTVIQQHGLPSRFDPQVLTYLSPEIRGPFLRDTSVEQGELPKFGALNGGASCLVWGDSHAMALVYGLDVACKNRGIQGFQATHSSTAPILNFVTRSKYGLNESASEFNQSVIDFAITREVDLVILHGAWSNYARFPNFKQRLAETVGKLHAAKIRVALVADVAQQNGNVPLMLAHAVILGEDVSTIGIPLKRYQDRNRAANDALSRMVRPGVRFLTLSPYFVDSQNIWRAEWDGKPMYIDNQHLSINGSLRLQPLFEQLFEQVGL